MSDMVTVSREDVRLALYNVAEDHMNGAGHEAVARLEKAIGEPQTETPDPWRRVDHCTCAGASLGPGAHETSCGWVEAEGA